MRFDLPPGRAQAAAILFPLGAYGLMFFFLYRWLGLSVTTAAILPVVVAAWLWGARAGLLTGPLGAFLNTLRANLAGRPGWEAVIGTPGGAMGALALVLAGGVDGRLCDLGERTRRDSMG
jgi:hypothetical protein